MEYPFLGSLDRAADRPVFKQIADDLRDAITSGQLEDGDLLPSEQELLDHYRVARMTIRAATRVLQDEGIAAARHGKGLYVRTPTSAGVRLPDDVRALLAAVAAGNVDPDEAAERATALLAGYPA
ncbi:MAG TPA: winged helix-turn-helix domain-containing protein [Streptosporangiaceae bacterium]|nr:winged helix-turn-helix domain-containing protein [Streptosporangiaceae bacterium]